jgi:predicted nucleic acid-binding protein
LVAFADSSALVKLYVREIGSRWMGNVVRPGGIAMSELAITEVGVALSRLARDGTISEAAARAAWRLFRRETQSFIVYRLDRRTLAAAAGLSARAPVQLRSLDAIQLQGATAASVQARRAGQPPPLVVSADTRLLAAAGAFGFATDNPLDHS